MLSFFASIDADLAGHEAAAPRVVASDQHVLNLLSKRAQVLHLTVANYCWFTDPSRGLFIPGMGGEPIITQICMTPQDVNEGVQAMQRMHNEHGIDCKPLLSSLYGFGKPSPVPPSISGTILISATELEGLSWGPGVLNPYEQFKRRRPDAAIRNVILVYHGTFDVPLLAAYSQEAGAVTHMFQGKLPEAITEEQAAVKEAPDSAEMHATLGRMLMMAGRTAEARQELGTALHLARTIHPEYQANLIRSIEQLPH